MPVRPFCNNEPGSGADDFPEGGPRSISPLGNGGGPRFPPGGGGGGFLGRPPHPPPPPPPGFGTEFHPAQFGSEPEILNGKLPTSPLMPPHPDGANQQQQQQFPSNLQVRRIFLIYKLTHEVVATATESLMARYCNVPWGKSPFNSLIKQPLIKGYDDNEPMTAHA